MNFRIPGWLLGVLLIASVGCEPRPVVVDPNDGDTTVIEEDDADVVVPPDTTPAEPGTGVDVNVGGDRGVDVNVTPGGADSNQGAGQSSSQPSTSNTPR
jgi:hypothetical protein